MNLFFVRADGTAGHPGADRHHPGGGHPLVDPRARQGAGAGRRGAPDPDRGVAGRRRERRDQRGVRLRHGGRRHAGRPAGLGGRRGAAAGAAGRRGHHADPTGAARRPVRPAPRTRTAGCAGSPERGGRGGGADLWHTDRRHARHGDHHRTARRHRLGSTASGTADAQTLRTREGSFSWRRYRSHRTAQQRHPSNDQPR